MGGSDSFPSQNISTGWEFSVSGNITVNELGYYDSGDDGLNRSHEVGIFRLSDNTLLTSATVPSGVGATLDNGFRYVPVPNTFLGPGSYAIMGLHECNGWAKLYCDLFGAEAYFCPDGEKPKCEYVDSDGNPWV